MRAAFTPTELVIRNDSAQHAGHAGADGDPTGESHFHVRMRAPAMADLNRLARHRAVHGALGPDLTRDIHALSLDLDA
nr:BolA family protein [Citreicella sp. C3M06]